MLYPSDLNSIFLFRIVAINATGRCMREAAKSGDNPNVITDGILG